MKSHLLAALLCVLAIPASAQDPACARSYYQGTAPIVANARLARGATELCFTEFAVIHSPLSRAAIWSAEHLTPSRIRAARSLQRADAFHPDSRLPSKDRAELADFARSGLDRGHLAPSGDMSTPEAQYESFTLSNIVAQDPDNNRHLFAGIEMAVRNLVERRGSLYVITGPLFTGAKVKQLNGRVLVPDRIFKVVFDPAAQKGAAYVVNNEPGTAYEVVSLPELEAMAGLVFFPSLPAEAKASKLPLPRPELRGRSDRGIEISSERVLKDLSRAAQLLTR